MVDDKIYFFFAMDVQRLFVGIRGKYLQVRPAEKALLLYEQGYNIGCEKQLFHGSPAGIPFPQGKRSIPPALHYFSEPVMQLTKEYSKKRGKTPQLSRRGGVMRGKEKAGKG
jgi:hypothetical protein